jgi:alkyl sulfatase BDS1-like metallo-beta-lactamase superfamily hydrolase
MFGRRSFLHSTAGAAGPILALSAVAPDAHGAPPGEATSKAAAAAAAIKQYVVTPEVNADLKAHGAIFERKIHKVVDNVYSAVGWSMCNTIMVVGSDGVIIVDAGGDIQSAREVAAEFRKISDKPVRAVIYTCFHSDHINGAKAFASAEDVTSGRVEVIAHETLLDNVTKSGLIGPILGTRTVYNFGPLLTAAEAEGANNGTGPMLRRDGEATFIAPNRTFSRRLQIKIAGVAMELVHVPSEAADEIAVFLPESKILLSAEVIPAQTFPVLHPLRGEAYRDPAEWYRSIDALRRFKAAIMVPAHGLPVVGVDKVEEVLRNYRDAIQYIHDQTVRHMNKGLTPDELVDAVKLPPHLVDFKPWMQEFFGTVSQAVRAIYQGYLGWFEGDPVTLAPVPRVERARREVELMGGRDHVLVVASKAFEEDDPQWAAELATRLIRINRDDMPARRLKTAAFRKLGYSQINAIWRNWYLSTARELDFESFNPMLIQRGIARGITSPDLVAALPVRVFVEGFTARLKAEETLSTTMTVGFRFPDIDESYGIEIRRGVAQVEDRLPERTDLTLTLDKPVLDRIRLGQITMRDAIASGAVQLTGGPPTDAARFFGYFEVPFNTPIWLALR